MSAALPPVALSLIGIGTGNPDHLTREAQVAMQAADLILLPHKGEDKAELAALLLPPATDQAPTLAQALESLTSAQDYLALARRLPPEARLILSQA